jgi:hypothetical protein
MAARQLIVDIFPCSNEEFVADLKRLSTQAGELRRKLVTSSSLFLRLSTSDLVKLESSSCAVLVIPAKAGLSTAELVIQFLLGSDLEAELPLLLWRSG